MKQIQILLVDDHPEVLKQIETRLSYEDDFKVCKIASLEELAGCLIECQPDVLLIDPYRNNELDVECIKLAKQMMSKLTIIVLAAVVDTSDHVELKKAGADYILEKCIDSIELLTTLRKVIVNEQN